MPTPFDLILEDFEEELKAIRLLVQAAADPGLGSPRTRVAGANAALLLLAATFEEFVRQVARAYARAVVETSPSYERLPPKLAATAWKRTLEGLARVQLNSRSQNSARENLFSDALSRFNGVFNFSRGDLTQDIYEDLIHNDNNMRPQEINSLFKISGLSNICFLMSANQELIDFVEEETQISTNNRIVERLEEFFERRNQAAHSINAMRSSGPGQIEIDLDMLVAFARALTATVETNISAP